MDFYVYIHRKKTTKEVFYVGKGKGNRAYQKSRRNKFWKNIVEKHDFIVDFVEVGLQEWAAFELEQNLIAYYGRRDLNDGPLVNATEGGEGAVGHIWSEELRAWRSEKTKEQFSSEEMRKKASDAKRGRKLTQEHRLLSLAALDRGREKQKQVTSLMLKEKWKDPEFRQKMSDRASSFKMPEEAKTKIANALSKPVKRSDGQVFKSISEAGRVLGRYPNKIVLAVNGKRKTAYGYKWEFVNVTRKAVA